MLTGFKRDNLMAGLIKVRPCLASKSQQVLTNCTQFQEFHVRFYTRPQMFYAYISFPTIRLFSNFTSSPAHGALCFLNPADDWLVSCDKTYERTHKQTFIYRAANTPSQYNNLSAFDYGYIGSSTNYPI